MTSQTGQSGLKNFFYSLGQRKTAYMLSFGFAAGLPYALLLGTLYAWLTDADVDLETMGVFSLIGLAYAFKFLWSPLVDRIKLPFLYRLGRRKSWIVPAQFLLAIVFVSMSMLNPQNSLGWYSLLAALGAFTSATQDIVVDAWRIDVADEKVSVDLLSSIYQLGYRIASIIGGAVALLMADLFSWPTVFFAMGVIMSGIALLSLFAPDSESLRNTKDTSDTYLLNPRIRTLAIVLIGIMWAIALSKVGTFMVLSLGADPQLRPDSVAFIRSNGPLIVLLTVVIPCIIAAILVRMESTGRYRSDFPQGGISSIDYGFKALVLPLMDIVGRLGWSSVIVMLLILSYRITDSIWGTFAYPFYLDELQYSKKEVAIASKTFGVGITILGITVGGFLLVTVGRMATLMIGAVTAAASNLLYADLASGGTNLAIAAQYSGFTWLLSNFALEEHMAKLMLAITGENLAAGLAGAAFIAYLSSITSKQYSAMQYALLSSLTFLVGTLGRGALGEWIEQYGYTSVFLATAAIGLVAVCVCAVEWLRHRVYGQ